MSHEPPVMLLRTCTDESRRAKVYLQVADEQEQQHQRWQRTRKKRKMRFLGKIYYQNQHLIQQQDVPLTPKAIPEKALCSRFVWMMALPFSVICRSSLLVQLDPRSRGRQHLWLRGLQPVRFTGGSNLDLISNPSKETFPLI